MPSFLPSSLQSSLLRAALSDGPDAVQAWHEWRRDTDVDTLDQESYRLLPLLYSNLRRLGVEDPALVRYRSVYKHTWYKNQLSFQTLATMLRVLHEAGVETLVLKDVVLALDYHPHLGLRPMNDFDVLVPSCQVESAVGALRAMGWTPVPLPNRFSPGAAGLYHSWGLRNGTRGERDLHWHACADGCQRDADQAFWSASLPFAVHGQATRALCATDLLLTILVHAYVSHDPVIRWVADAAMIVRTAGDQIDWNRFADQTSRRHLVLPVRAALGHLHDSGLVPIPTAAIRTLELARTGWMDRAEYAHRQSTNPYSLPNRFARLWFWNWRLRGLAPALSTAASFPGFLRRYVAQRRCSP